jgi:O-antigen ligase
MSSPTGFQQVTVEEGVTPYRATLATLGFFTLMAGDFWRYLLSWWGWGAVVAILFALGVVEIARSRIDLRRMPLLLLATLALMTGSIAWSAYPGASAIGVAATLVTTTFGVFLANCYTWPDLIDALARATRLVLAASLLFEVIVAFGIRAPVLPFWVDYSHLENVPQAFYWSRDVLLDGGRIQGIVGNANILAMIALLALIAEVARLAAGRAHRVGFAVWTIIAVSALALTRSSTVLVASAIVVVIALSALFARRGAGPRRVATAVGVIVGIAASAVAAILFRVPLLALLGRSEDLTNRLDIWAVVFGLADERPVGGWGWVSYWPPWVEPFDDLVVIKGVTYLQAHNAWLDIYLQLGIVGLVLVGLYVLTTIFRSWSFALDGPRDSALVPIALLAALITQSLAESRLLVEIGWALLVVVSIRTATNRWGRR